jgi:mono/diheme cytochrome c family protein
MVMPAAAAGRSRRGADIPPSRDGGGLSFIRAGREALCALWVVGVLGLPLAAAHGQTSASIARGKDIAERACAGCHAIDGRQGETFQSTDVPSFRALAGRPERTPESLQTYIMTPKHPMPAIPLEFNEIRDVVDYIRSLK